ncbi:hypothetical protein ABW20_dc0108261 [Dactylellina cionopaga]|nr:hypothetical protein ABW20_dc0108261 [Dactylellina cionopaga]
MAANFNWGTTGNEAVQEFADLIRGKTILITGVAPGGLGGETAITLSKAHPKLLLLHARSEDKIAPIAKTVQEAGVPVKNVIMNLSSLASVREAADNVISQSDVTIDVIINCTGVMATPYVKTADGFEQQFGINHLAHFLFTNLLLKAGKIAEGGRIVNLTSGAHIVSGIIWDDIGFSDGEKYDKSVAYAQSKTANVLFSKGLAEKLKPSNITSFSVHPGVIWSTNLARDLTEEEITILESRVTAIGQEAKELNQGVSTSVVAAFSPLIVDQSGAYLFDCQIQQEAPHASGSENASRLWAVSEEMVGEKFSY